MAPQRQIKLKHDKQISIAIGRSRKETKWKNVTMQYSAFLAKIAETTRTRESFQEYQRMSRDQRSNVKDVGGFVAGVIRNGRRISGAATSRSMLTLDVDFASSSFWSQVEVLIPYAAAMYTTHSHDADKPKMRLIIPLGRDVSADEYSALSRFVAAEIDIEMFDDTTYQPERLMYWPSTAEDGEFIFEYQDAEFLDPDVYLEEYPNWRDQSTWPVSSREHQIHIKTAEKQGEPTEKPGVIGAFNRLYTISEAIEKFLSDVYEECDINGRYTFIGGTTSAGVVVYDDKFAYSHHGTDPAGGILCNAFDLVRIHKFGKKDTIAKADTPIHKMPSYEAMTEWAIDSDAVKVELAEHRATEAKHEFEAFTVESESNEADHKETKKKDKDWRTKLTFSQKGGIVQSIHNAILILRHDQLLKGAIAVDEFTRKTNLKKTVPWKTITEPEPWTDGDDAALRHYLEVAYGMNKKSSIDDAVAIVSKENAYHPIREYLDKLVWDGEERLETMLIDYLGVDDNDYTRQISKKWMTAGAARIRRPGVKFDNMLILVGDQGVGKSQFFNRLAKRLDWFSDSMSKFDNSKESMEQLAGKWIVELGELSAMKKYEVEHVKVFLSKQEDSYRPSYGRRIEMYPRQCLFGGTTNREDFLQDATGARRFWPVKVEDTRRLWQEMTPELVDQLWAEADYNYQMGEALYLSDAALTISREQHEIYTELGGKVGAAEEFLQKQIRADWSTLALTDKVDWINGNSLTLRAEVDLIDREEISGVELFVECFGGRIDNFTKRDAYEMSDILTSLGWTRKGNTTRMLDYGKQRMFTRKKTTKK